MNKIFILGMMFFSTCDIKAQSGRDSLEKLIVVSKEAEIDIDDKIFTKVEQEAAFPGGDQGWRQYLVTNLNASVPVENGAKKGTYKVVIRFIVSKDGSVSNVEAETRFKHGMEEECIRVIKNGPKWEPAYQNGRPVRAYRRQPITFVVEEAK